MAEKGDLRKDCFAYCVPQSGKPYCMRFANADCSKCRHWRTWADYKAWHIKLYNAPPQERPQHLKGEKTVPFDLGVRLKLGAE